MNIFELLVVLGLFSVVLALSGWLGHVVGVDPWMLALPVVVLGLHRVWGGRWVTVAAALAVGATVALLAHLEWIGVAFCGGLAFYVLRRYGLWRWERREASPGES